jgi:hypothetical protein
MIIDPHAKPETWLIRARTEREDGVLIVDMSDEYKKWLLEKMDEVALQKANDEKNFIGVLYMESWPMVGWNISDDICDELFDNGYLIYNSDYDEYQLEFDDDKDFHRVSMVVLSICDDYFEYSVWVKHGSVPWETAAIYKKDLL